MLEQDDKPPDVYCGVDIKPTDRKSTLMYYYNLINQLDNSDKEEMSLLYMNETKKVKFYQKRRNLNLKIMELIEILIKYPNLQIERKLENIIHYMIYDKSNNNLKYFKANKEIKKCINLLSNEKSKN